MKRAQRTDLIREMRKSFNRYISILLIMALGVAFYAGVRSAEPDMQLSAKRHFDETNYMDIRVLGTLGVTEDDVVQIAKIEGNKVVLEDIIKYLSSNSYQEYLSLLESNSFNNVESL